MNNAQKSTILSQEEKLKVLNQRVKELSVWENFASNLISNHIGKMVTEENLQAWLEESTSQGKRWNQIPQHGEQFNLSVMFVARHVGVLAILVVQKYDNKEANKSGFLKRFPLQTKESEMLCVSVACWTPM